MSQRIIKFRTWDTMRKKWRDLSIAYNPHTHENYGIDGEEGHYPASHGYVFQQSTGHKDKNGKEIYEGDIVKGHVCEKDYHYEVVYYVPYACFLWLPTTIGPNMMEFISTVNIKDFMPNFRQSEELFEIVGNIFENEELRFDENAK